jgi:hypothetical protein
MGGACSTNGRREINARFWSETLNGRDYWEGLDVDGKIILEWILGK